MPETKPLQQIGPMAGHAPDQERPLGAYGALMTLFATLFGAFAAWFSRSGRSLPERVSAADMALLTVASHKLSRTITRDRVTSVVRAPFTRLQADAGYGEVDERARGRGLRRAIGELLVCPYCVALWVIAAFTVGLLLAPRATRWTASLFVCLTGSDLLQMAYAKAEAAL